MLRESYGVMRKRYEEVEQLVDQKTEIRRTASAERDWAGVPEALRARDVLIERALKAFERHEKMVVGLRDQLVRWGRAPPSPPDRDRIRTRPHNLLANSGR